MSGALTLFGSAATSNGITLVIGGVQWAGWTEVSIAVGCEVSNASFDLAVTERFPADPSGLDILPGQTCQVFVGSDPLVTGYVDRYDASLSPEGHRIRILGRGRCCDLVDCHVDLIKTVPNGQISSPRMVPLAQTLCGQFGIPVTTVGTVPNDAAPFLNFPAGTSPWDLIEGFARWKALLVYENTSGSLVISPVGSASHASGFAQGMNVQEAEVSFDMDSRFSTYQPFQFPTVQSLTGQASTAQVFGAQPAVTDQGVLRPRLRYIITDLYYQNQYLCELQAKWEAARRWGRSQAVTLVCDSWRDSAGQLWTPNQFAMVDLPALKLPQRNWIVGSVEFRLGLDGGTTSVVTLMPKEAFVPEPSFPANYDNVLAQVQQQTSPGSASPSSAALPS